MLSQFVRCVTAMSGNKSAPSRMLMFILLVKVSTVFNQVCNTCNHLGFNVEKAVHAGQILE